MKALHKLIRLGVLSTGLAALMVGQTMPDPARPETGYDTRDRDRGREHNFGWLGLLGLAGLAGLMRGRTDVRPPRDTRDTVR